MIETSAANRPAQSEKRSSVARIAKFVLIAAILAAIAAAVVIWGIDSRVKTAAAVKQETAELAVPTVAVARPRPGALRNEVVLPGNIQAFTDAPIYARASGYLKKWEVDIGGQVKAGQVLAEIEAPELDQQVHQATASLEQAQSALEQALANLQQGKANEELARITSERWSSLAAQGVVSRQEDDQYRAQYQAQVANVQALEKAIAAQRSNIAASQANLARLQELQGYKTVRAPFDGVITARNTDVGALINAGNGGPAQELFHIASIDKLRVFVNIPQADSRFALPGIPAALTLAEFPGRRFPGQLARTAEAMDAGTRTLLAEVDVDNPSSQLKPGAFAEVHLMIPSGVPSMILPVSAIMFRSEGLRVGVLREGSKAELIPVILGKDYGNEVEVVSGIAETDSVIVDPPDSLNSGTVVRVVPKR